MEKKFVMSIFAGAFCVNGKNLVTARVTRKGTIAVSSAKLKNKLIPNENIPLLRGVEFVFFSLIYFFSALTNSFVNSSEKRIFENKSPYKKEQFYFGGGVLAFGLIFSIILLGIIPTHLGFALFQNNYNLFFKKFCIAVTKCVIFYVILLLISFFPEIKNLWKFNTAGNIAITGKKHRPLNFFNIIFFALILQYFIVTLLGISTYFLWKILINFGFLLLSISITFEVALLLEKKGGKWYNLSAVIGVLTTAVPSKTELRVVKTAISEGILMEENIERDTLKEDVGGVSFAYILSEVKSALKKKNMDEFGEAEWLIASALSCKKMDLKFLKTITKQEEKSILKALSERLEGKPIDKIFGFTEFYGLKFLVNKNVLTPRQETEILVEETLKLIKEKKLKSALDLCTGSGAIAISLAKNANIKVYASDISEKALLVARKNAENLNAKIIFKQSDLFQKFHLKKFDVIVSNPPYIRTADIETLSAEVKNYDPILALDGGVSGLEFYEKIIASADKYLSKNGVILFEVGVNQAEKVKKLLTGHYSGIKIIKDYNGVKRVVIATKKGTK